MARDTLFACKTLIMSVEVCQQRWVPDFLVSWSLETSVGKCGLPYAVYKSEGMTEMKDIPSSFTHIY